MMRGGMGNMQKMMKQMQKMQREMAQAQEQLAEERVEGTAGGGLVKVIMNGKKVVSGITINPDAIDMDDLTMLEDLIIAAMNDGYDKADEVYQEEMCTLWREIAKHYVTPVEQGGRSDLASTILSFDLVNEPVNRYTPSTGKKQWDVIVILTVSRILKITIVRQNTKSE